MKNILTEQSQGPRPWVLAVWYFFLAVITTYALHYWMWSEGPDRLARDMLATHERVVTAVDWAPVQYRYVSYVIPELVHRVLPISVQAAYALVRASLTTLAFTLLHLYLRRWFDWRLSTIGVLILATSLPFLTAQNDLQPSDIPDLVFLLLSLVLLTRERSEWLLLSVPVSMVFRETAFYQLLLWAAVMPSMQDPKRELKRLALAAVLAIAIYIGIRVYFGYRPFAYRITTFSENITSPRRYYISFLALNIFWLLGWLSIRHAPRFLARAALLVPVIVTAVWVLGNPAEPRLWLPLFPILIPLGLLALSGET